MGIARLSGFFFLTLTCSAQHLEAIHAQRVEWMKNRRAAPLPGVYRDFRAVPVENYDQGFLDAARNDDVQVLLMRHPAAAAIKGFVVEPIGDMRLPVLPENPASFDRKETRELEKQFKQYPDEAFALGGPAMFPGHWDVALRHSNIHILARELTEADVRASLDAGRLYLAQDWLCNPAGFFFIVENSLGAYDIGDHAPALKNTRFVANLPVAAKIKLIHNGIAISEVSGSKFSFIAREPGGYHLEAWLTVDGEDRLWISSNPIYLDPPAPLELPTGEISPRVEVHKDVAYLGDGAPLHTLDLYLPKDKKNFPVMVFLHGGAWRSGDRSAYPLFGNRFAAAGIGVAVPNYRLMPRNPYPAQPEDAAAAFAWVYRHIAELGGDVSRIFVAGHSAGGHLASLVALDPKYLAKFDLSPAMIHGVISMSGIYDVGGLPEFQNADDDPSPLHRVHLRAPPFLITYCQWDYLGLPRQAREFAAALKGKFIYTKMVYVAGESHVSEIVSTVKSGDATTRAILDFIQ